MKNVKFNVSENIVVYAFRYCLSRQTGAVDECIKLLYEIWDKLEKWTQDQIMREVDMFLNQCQYVSTKNVRFTLEYYKEKKEQCELWRAFLINVAAKREKKHINNMKQFDKISRKKGKNIFVKNRACRREGCGNDENCSKHE